MRTSCPWLKRVTKLGLILMVGVSMSACSTTSWKEEVLLHDGSKIIVERSQIREGRHEIGQGPPIKEQSNTFTPPGSNKPITWKSEFSADIGHANFYLLALDILNGTPYIVTNPAGCLAYNKWGRPNPPYIFFKYVNQQWKQIPLAEFPVEIKQLNVVLDTYGHGDVEREVKSGFISADSVKKLNSDFKQEEFKTILREPVKRVGPEGCAKMVPYGKGGWLGLDWFSDQPSYEACLKFCESKGVSPQNCPCNFLFKGK